MKNKDVVIKIDNLVKYYGEVKGIENLNLELYKGEVFGLIGPNGAGKSTTIRSIMNLINITSGDIYIKGKNTKTSFDEVKEVIGYLPSEVNLYDDLTVKSMLDFHESFYKKDLSENRKRLVELFQLDESKFIEDLSLGNKKKLGIILALMHEPEILILDEATSGLDPIMQERFYKLLKEANKKGTLILYSTHVLSEVSKICDRVGIVKDGHLLDVLSIKELKKDKSLIINIKSKEIDKILLNKDFILISIDNDIYTIKTNIESDLLIKTLSKYKIDEIYINNKSIDSLFLDYYKEDK